MGLLLVAAALVVGFPAAALTINSGARHIAVATDRPPLDSPTWLVACESALQRAPVANDLDRAVTSGCSRSTRPWRWAGEALGVVSLLVLGAGVVLLVVGGGAAPSSDVPDSVEEHADA